MPPWFGEARQQVAHPPDPGGVGSVGGLVEDQHLGVSEECGGDTEPLAHAEGVVAHPALGLGGCQAHQLEHLVDARAGQAHRGGGDREDLAAGATGVLRGGVQQDAHLEAGVGEVGEPFSVDGRGAGCRDGQTDHHAHRGGLAGAVRTEETGHAAGLGGEGDVVDGGEAGVPPGQ